MMMPDQQRGTVFPPLLSPVSYIPGSPAPTLPLNQSALTDNLDKDALSEALASPNLSSEITTCISVVCHSTSSPSVAALALGQGPLVDSGPPEDASSRGLLEDMSALHVAAE